MIECKICGRKFYIGNVKARAKRCELSHGDVMRDIRLLRKIWHVEKHEHRKRLRRDCAVYRLYRYHHLSPKVIFALLFDKSLQECVSESIEEKLIKVIIGRIFSRICLESPACILKPYLFREE